GASKKTSSSRRSSTYTARAASSWKGGRFYPGRKPLPADSAWTPHVRVIATGGGRRQISRNATDDLRDRTKRRPPMKNWRRSERRSVNFGRLRRSSSTIGQGD